MCCFASLGPIYEHVVLRRHFFALQQVSRFMLLMVSTDAKERDWAWDDHGAMSFDFEE